MSLFLSSLLSRFLFFKRLFKRRLHNGFIFRVDQMVELHKNWLVLAQPPVHCTLYRPTLVRKRRIRDVRWKQHQVVNKGTNSIKIWLDFFQGNNVGCNQMVLELPGRGQPGWDFFLWDTYPTGIKVKPCVVTESTAFWDIWVVRFRGVVI